MRITRCLSLAIFLFASAVGATLAQTFPVKPIRLIVPYAPGGASDILGRKIAQRMGEILGQPMIVENKAGASGAIGSEYVAKAPSDGYTLLLANIGTHGVNPVLYKNLPYDVSRDFAPVGLAFNNQFIVLVSQSVPARTLPELVAYSKKGKLFLGTTGYTQQLLGAMLATNLGVETSNVSYNDTARKMTDLASGNIQVVFTDITGALPFIKLGKAVPIAVTGSSRFSGLPDVPTLAEVAKTNDFETVSWMGLVSPTGTPPAVISKLNAALNEAMGAPEIKESFASFAAEAVTGTPEQFGTLMRNEIEKWGRVAKTAGIKAE